MKHPKNVVAAALLAGLLAGFPAQAYEVFVFSDLDEVVGWLESEDWYGEVNRGEHLDVPHAMITGINPRWREAAQALPVPQKKEIFYRLMLPLIMHANGMVMDRRERLIEVKGMLDQPGSIGSEDMELIREGAVLLRVMNEDEAGKLTAESSEFAGVIDELLYKLDIIPNGLALGQAAYESGYGTSRFAVEGNALFGQWTYGGKGLVPEQQRKELGDHRIAAYDWPFDSVRDYFINLSSHPAYEEFRRLRADIRATGNPLGCMELAQGLKSYSERGQKYVDTLRGIIRVNNLAIADNAVFRDEPMRFLLTTADEASAVKLRQNIEAMQKSGEIEQIVKRMRLE